jgi:hypothetical protein
VLQPLFEALDLLLTPYFLVSHHTFRSIDRSRNSIEELSLALIRMCL